MYRSRTGPQMLVGLPPSALVHVATELTNMRDEMAYIKVFLMNSPRLPHRERHVFVSVDKSMATEKTWLLRSFEIGPVVDPG